MNIVVNIFIAVFINFCQHFTEIPKNADFWMKSPFSLKKNKFLLVNFHETRSQKTKKDFKEVYRRTILKDENHVVLEKNLLITDILKFIIKNEDFCLYLTI